MEDIDVLPLFLKERSLSPTEIVLKCEDALQAIDILEANKWFILGWEPWWKLPYGHNHPLEGGDFSRYPGESWDESVYRIANECREVIKREQKRWDQEHPIQGEVSETPPCMGQPPHTILYFCLTASDT